MPALSDTMPKRIRQVDILPESQPQRHSGNLPEADPAQTTCKPFFERTNALSRLSWISLFKKRVATN